MDRRHLTALRRTDEQPILSTNGYPLHLSLGYVAVDCQKARFRITY
jgi:hypothetical protein